MHGVIIQWGDDDQPRDEGGRWTDGGGSGDAGEKSEGAGPEKGAKDGKASAKQQRAEKKQQVADKKVEKAQADHEEAKKELHEARQKLSALEEQKAAAERDLPAAEAAEEKAYEAAKADAVREYVAEVGGTISDGAGTTDEEDGFESEDAGDEEDGEADDLEEDGDETGDRAGEENTIEEWTDEWTSERESEWEERRELTPEEARAAELREIVEGENEEFNDAHQEAQDEFFAAETAEHEAATKVEIAQAHAIRGDTERRSALEAGLEKAERSLKEKREQIATSEAEAKRGEALKNEAIRISQQDEDGPDGEPSGERAVRLYEEGKSVVASANLKISSLYAEEDKLSIAADLWRRLGPKKYGPRDADGDGRVNEDKNKAPGLSRGSLHAMPAVTSHKRTKRRTAASSPIGRAAFMFDAATLPVEGGAKKIDTRNPKWIQVCASGTFKGYRGGGREFTIDRPVLDAMVSNLQRHPSYKAGVVALSPQEISERVAAGDLGVIPFDFDHQGGPAQAWALDLEVREGDAGTIGLWAFTFFLEPAYTWMCEARYKWTSITWEENATDPITAKKVGPNVMAVALTNDPFVQGMTAIQARRTGTDFGGYSYDPWNPPSSAVELVCALRLLFGLSEIAPLEDILAAISNLRGWVEQTLPVPPGVDVQRILRDLRRALGLKALDEPALIFAELDKLLGRLADEQENETPMPDPIKTTPEPVPLARVFALRLSALTGQAVADDQESVIRSFDGVAGRFDEAMGHVAALKKMLGTDNPKEISAKLAQLMAIADQMAEMIGAVKAEHEAEEKAEGEMAAKDVAQVMAAMRLNPQQHAGTYTAFMAQRLGNAPPVAMPSAAAMREDPKLFSSTLAAFRARAEQRAKLREEFFRSHQIGGSIQVPAHLQGVYGPTLFAGQGALFSPDNAGGPPQGAAAPHTFGNGPPPAPPPQGGNTWSWARVAQLPPSQTGDNAAQRIFDEVVRAEFGGKVAGATYDRAWARTNQIFTGLGPMPPSLLRAS